MTTELHVRWRDLVELRDQRLSVTRAAKAALHLASGCAVCVGNARRIDQVLGAIREGPPAAPPAEAAREAMRIFRETNLDLAREIDRVVGVLIADRADQLAASLRACPGATRRLLWQVGRYALDASVVARAGGADLLAQIVPAGDDPDAVVTGVVTARMRRRVRGRAPVEPDGRFTFRGLPRGVCTIEGRVDAMAFVLPPLNLE